VLLMWIAIKLLGPEESASDEIQPPQSLWHAIKIIVIADWVMSLDNVIAIAAAARGSYALLMFGLAVSIPLIMLGAVAIMALIERFPIITWAGAALLGWIAGEIIAKDPSFTASLDQSTAHALWLVGATLGALFVVISGIARRWWLRRSASDQM
jgi:predicted tellurium resistance membrane protein TerC